MRLLKWTLSGVMAVVPLTWAGCHEHRHEVVVQEQQPVVVAPAPAPVVVVAEPPPVAVVEVVPAHCPHGQIWIGGYYVYEDHHYVWRRGHFEAPPHRGAAWEAPRWEHGEHGYEYHPGGWHNGEGHSGHGGGHGGD